MSPGPLHAPLVDYLAVLPVIILLGGAVALLVWSSLLRRPLEAVWTTSITVLVAAAALALSLFQWADVSMHGPKTAIAKAVALDGFSAFVSVLVCSAVLVVALVADGWLERAGADATEFQALMLISASGAVVMGMANDLLVVFLGLEILSISLYVLAALDARRAESGEAALKYFVLGSLSSAIFLFGSALVYGSTGSTNLGQIADFLAHNVVLHDGLLIGGLALLLVGFGFKVAAVPFHLWTPDVYQGAPTPVTGFLAAISKAGAFAALLRVFASSFSVLREDWRPIVWVIAAASLVLGAAVAILQRDIKRMLAYSSINHAGFILLGLQAATVAGASSGLSASLFYLFTYSFMVIGSFAVVLAVAGHADDRHGLDRYRGLARREPLLAGCLAVLLLAQAGVPFTTGFWAKLEVINAAVHAGSTDLAVIAMLSAAVAAFFYLRVGVLMYLPGGASESGVETGAEPAPDEHPARAERESVLSGLGSDETGALELPAGEGQDPGRRVPVPATLRFAALLCVGVTVFFGFVPGLLIDFAQKATFVFPH